MHYDSYGELCITAQPFEHRARPLTTIGALQSFIIQEKSNVRVASRYSRKPWTKFINSDNQCLVVLEVVDILDKLLRYDHQERPTTKEAMGFLASPIVVPSTTPSTDDLLTTRNPVYPLVDSFNMELLLSCLEKLKRESQLTYQVMIIKSIRTVDRGKWWIEDNMLVLHKSRIQYNN
ncbi:hypothetical protein Tco_1126373 [Tanacetum coccineum]